MEWVKLGLCVVAAAAALYAGGSYVNVPWGGGKKAPAAVKSEPPPRVFPRLFPAAGVEKSASAGEASAQEEEKPVRVDHLRALMARVRARQSG